MTKEMYEDLLERNKLQISELNTLTEEQDKHIVELEKENAELKEAIKHFNPCSEWNDDVHDCEFIHYAVEYGSKLTKAKDLIRNLLRVTWGEGWNYSLDWKVKAEQYLKDLEK